MARLIADLRETTKTAQNRACVAVCNAKVKPLRLQIFASTRMTSALPDKLIQQHWRNDNGS
jgi:hypothetical protein